MANALKTYLQCIKVTLEAALCIRNFPSQQVERHNKPEIFFGANKELLLNPVTITRNKYESVLIEPSINSIRVSVKIKKMDELEKILAHKFTRFLMQRADHFVILRRKPIAGYDISFLIINSHLESMYKHKIIDFIIQFMQDANSDVSLMKLAVNSRARAVAKNFISEVAQVHP
jgi:actin related protein 2/3 complex subunit 4